MLMQDFGLVVAGAMAVVLLSVFAMWLIVIMLLIILLPTYLLGVLRSAIQHPAIQHPAIQKIALRLQKGVLKESEVPAPAAVRFPGRAWALLFAPICRVKLWLRNARVRLANNDYTSIFLPIW